MKNDMKITVEILSERDGFRAVMQMKHDFLDDCGMLPNIIVSKPQASRGQLKRKVIQFCDGLGLEMVWE